MSDQNQRDELPQGTEIDQVSAKRKVDAMWNVTVSTELAQFETGEEFWLYLVEVAFESPADQYLDRLEITLNPDDARQLAGDLQMLADIADESNERSKSDQP